MSKLTNYLLFIIPSLLGMILFLVPINIGDEVIVPIGLLIDFTSNLLGDYLKTIVLVIIVTSAIASCVTYLFKPKFVLQNSFLSSLFTVNTSWLVVRLLGALYAIIVYFEVYFEFIYSGATGGLILNDLLTLLIPVFFFAGIFTILLLNYGLLEFVGTYLYKIMRPIFKLPGRSSVDCMTSWLGDGTVGVMITNKQYVEGYYSKFEASVIATCFSLVSITFSFVVIETVNLRDYFFPFYLTVGLAGIVAAIVVPRIPPLSKKKQVYYNDMEPQLNETIPDGESIHSFALKSALLKAQNSGGIKEFAKSGVHTVLSLWIAVVPAIMALGTTAVIIAEYTPIFEYLGYPFYPLLELMQVPEALAASKTMIIGFADMLLPTIIATSGATPITNPMTLFIIASLSVSQLVYMSEVGGIIISSKIPISIIELFMIFIIRTLVTLPIIVLMAHLIF